MFSAYELEDSYPKNPLAALFNQAVLELAILSRWIVENLPDGDTQASVTSQKNLPAFDLAGMGDLHVTVGGGRNSRLGRYLGDEQRLSQVLQGPMKGVTVEGVDTGRRLLPGFQAACASGALTSEFLPLTRAILASIDQDELFKFDFSSLPG